MDITIWKEDYMRPTVAQETWQRKFRIYFGLIPCFVLIFDLKQEKTKKQKQKQSKSERQLQRQQKIKLPTNTKYQIPSDDTYLKARKVSYQNSIVKNSHRHEGKQSSFLDI